MRRRILIVEDNAGLRELLRHVFVARDFEVIEADSGIEALAQARGGSFDAALVDIDLPIINGFQICAFLRQAFQPPAMWMMTGSEEPEMVCHSLAAGALALFRKPFSTFEVCETVCRRLARPRATEAPVRFGVDSRLRPTASCMAI